MDTHLPELLLLAMLAEIINEHIKAVWSSVWGGAAPTLYAVMYKDPAKIIVKRRDVNDKSNKQ